jgi:ubiquinone/menaquinone biosynthesis C-methylase UbiE
VDIADIDRPRAFYDTVAAGYARMLPVAGSYAAPLDLAVLDHFIALLGSPAGAVLDAGCGAGRMTRYLRERSISDVAGVDLSQGMIEQARSAYPETPFAVGDLAALPYAAGRFRGVLAWYSIIHTAPDACGSIIAELARVLAPGGHLLLAYQAGTGQRRIDKAYGHDVSLRAYLHDTGYLRDALTAGGFAPVVTVERAPWAKERSAQGFLIARRS